MLLDNKRNTNGLPYNPITLEYARNEHGERMRLQDEDRKVRGYVRAQNLVERSCKYNLLTGETKRGMEAHVPKHLRSRFDEKLEQKREREAIKYEPIRDKYDYLDD